MKKCKSRTFQKGDDYGELMEYVMKHVDSIDWQPEGTNWSGGEPGPYDPVCELDAKYIVTITKITEKQQPEKR